MFDFDMKIHEEDRTFIDGKGNQVVVIATIEDEIRAFEVFYGSEAENDAYIIAIIYPETTESLNAHLELVVSNYTGELPSHMTGYFADEPATLRLIEQCHHDTSNRFGRKGAVLKALVSILRERWTIADVPDVRSTFGLMERFEQIQPILATYNLAADLESLAQFCSGVRPAPFIGFKLLDAVVADIHTEMTQLKKS
ncbi:hypothetical protein [Paraburkholderia aromaticivorans]|uniref:hypothetical protein n=1 Tax=Paraburkholderia aromaticivorans TaxID=2026199 RepID=UPI0038BD14D1